MSHTDDPTIFSVINMATTKQLNLSINDLKKHKSFLQKIHLKNFDENTLKQAVFKYENFLAKFNEAPCIPPADVAWLWHCHRLAPKFYKNYCLKNFGKILEPGQSAFEISENQHSLNSPRAQVSEINYDILSAAGRQKSFLWHVSNPNFSEDEFLKNAIERYAKFLELIKIEGYGSNFFVPSYDVDFCWHTHILLSTGGYFEDTEVHRITKKSIFEKINDIIQHIFYTKFRRRRSQP